MFSHHKYCPAMPTVDEFWRIAALVAAERGGLVVGFTRDSEQPELGSALDNVFGFAPQSPVTVMNRSDWADWIEQVEAFYRLKPDWGRAKRGTADANYYRVKFDTTKFEPKLDEFDAPVRSTSISSFGVPAAYATMAAAFGGSATPLSGFQGVSFWPRVLARVIDFVVHYIASFLAGLLFALILTVAAGGRPPARVLQRLFQNHYAGFIAGILGLVAYNVICTSVCGITSGKTAAADASDPGRRLPTAARSRRSSGNSAISSTHYSSASSPTLPCAKTPSNNASATSGPTLSFAGGYRCHPPARGPERNSLLGLLFGIAADMALLMIGWLIQMNS